MKNTRTLLVVVICFCIVLFSLLSGILSVVIIQTYQSFEENEMHSRIHRFSDSLNNSMVILERSVMDYAVWDEMARYSLGKNPAFPEEQMSDESFVNMSIDIVCILGSEGQPLYLRDLTGRQDLNNRGKHGLWQYLGNESPLVHSADSPGKGMYRLVFNTGTSSGILVSYPIGYHTIADQATGGTVLMGRYFSDPFLDEISIPLKQRIGILPRPDLADPVLTAFLSDPSQNEYVRSINQSAIAAYLKVMDPVSNEPTVFYVVYPRTMYEQGISTLVSYLLVIALVMGVFAAITIIVFSLYRRYADVTERELLKKEDSYQKIIEELEDAYFRADSEGIVEKVSPSAIRMFGYTDADDVIGMPLSALYQNPDEREQMREILFSERQLKSHPLVLKRKDGSLIFVSANVHLIISEDGSVIGMEGIAHDNTEIIHAERKTRENESFYRLIFESANIGLFQSTPSGTFILVNPAFASMLGYESPEEIRQDVRDSARDLYVDPPVHEEVIRELELRGTVRNKEIRFRKKDLSEIWLNINLVTIRDVSEQIAAYFGTAIDITEKKRIESELIESRQKFHSLFYLSPIAIMAYDSDGNLIDANSAAISIFGVADMNVMETEPLFYHPYLTDEHRQDLLNGRYVETDIMLDFDNLRLKYHFPSSRTGIGYLHLIVTRISHPDQGKPGWFIALIQDITDRKMAEIARNIADERLNEAEIVAKLGHWDMDNRTGQLFWSDAIYSIFERDSGSFGETYESFLEMVHPEDRLLVDHSFQQHLLEKTPYDITHRILLPDNRVKYVRQICKTEWDSSDKPVHSIGIVHDVTSIRVSELALRESELKYRQMFTNVSHGLILFELNADGKPGKIMDANPKAEELLQKTLSEILEHNDSLELYLPIYRSEYVHDITYIDADICSFESRILQSGGNTVPVNVTLDIFRLEDMVVGLTIIEDITLKKLYEEERVRLIQQIEKNLAELAILNDGIRNPLTIMMLMVDELEEEISGPVLAQIRAIDDLIRQLDKRWVESDKILQFLQKHNYIGYKKN